MPSLQVFSFSDNWLNFQLFADGSVTHAGQAIGIICAETQLLAYEAAKMVKVSYTDVAKEKPIITCQDAIDSGDDSRIQEMAIVPATRKGSISGNIQEISLGPMIVP